MNNEYFKREVEPNQSLNGNLHLFDCDSSPLAWKHYKRVYTDSFWNDYNIQKPEFRTRKRVNNRYQYVNKPGNRLVAVFVDEKSDFHETKNLNNAGLRVGGETDFNFNRTHKHFFQAIIDADNNHNETSKSRVRLQLQECSYMHHTLCNFSLMQVMGQLQQFKGKRCHDRLDRFVFWLNSYYETNEDDRAKHPIIVHAGNPNNDYLREYLNCFKDIMDYCDKIYFIPNDKKTVSCCTILESGDREKHHGFALVYDLIESGKKPINSLDDVCRYLTLAERFWKTKESAFLDIYIPNHNEIFGALFSNGGETYTIEDLKGALSISSDNDQHQLDTIDAFTSYYSIVENQDGNYVR